ncbi:MAG: helix-hairpin-helix domain-containing protein [Caldisericia bacterium]|nr:helix-hairpin-helix domain-containing protein [Caldisericia bacterium]
MDWFEWVKEHSGYVIACIIIGLVCFFLGTQYQSKYSASTETTSALTSLDETTENNPETIEVYVCGEVLETKVVELPSSARWEDAIQAAGGLLDSADRNQINLAKSLKNGEKVFVPKKAEVVNQNGSVIMNKTITSTQVPINSATKELLMTLPGIGEVKAEAILQYREDVGRFEELEDLMKVSGIGEKTFEKLKELIRLD